MNGLLRHTGNIHIGMIRSSALGFLGLIYKGIKSGLTFTADTLRSTATTIGLIRNTRL